MIKPTVKQITSDSAISGPQFSFSEYAVNTVYHNDGQKIDFVTDGEDLYVFAVRNDENEPTTKPTLKEEAALGRFIKLVSKGATGKDGAPGKQGPAGEVPRISARFDGKQLILKSGTETIAVTGDLTGPAWKPEKQGDQIVWMETKDRTKPEPIDLSDLRERERPLLLRVDSDNTKRSDEISGPANMIQWKYEGDEHWTNLIAIDDLLNIALAGVCTWKSEEDGNWHIGHKEVVKATYDSNKDGKRIISQVELGDVLFDAGPIAKDMQLDIAVLEARLNEIEEILRGINVPSLDGYATEDWVNAQGFLKNIPDTYAKKSDIPTDYVKSIKLNGESHSPVNGVVDLGDIESGTVDAYTKAESDARYQPKGNYLTQHQPLKTINGQSLVGTGDITISGGQPVDLSGVVKSLTIDGQNKTPDSNGNISFTLGNFNLFNLEARTINGERHLIKVVNGTETDLGVFGTGSGEGCDKCWSEEEILALITEEINKIPDVDLSGFYRKAEVDALIQNLQNQINALIADDPTIVAISFISTTIYTRTNDTTAPSVQTSFAGEHIALDESGDVSETALTEKLESVDSIWSTSPGNGNNYLWVSYARVKIPDGIFTSDWSTPVRLTGVPGRDGSDGGDIEFVYYRNNGEQPGVSNTGRYYDPDTETYSEDTTDASQDDFFPKVVLTGETADAYWQDHPEGISSANTHEWVAIRTKKRGGSWGNFSVSLWSRWGEDGVDGDGVQYIFTWSNEFPHTFTGTENPTTWDTTTERYQSKYEEYVEGDWVDDPRGVSAEHPFEWVSIRKRRRVNGVYGWQPYSAPALWSTYAESATTRTIVTLDLDNSEEPVAVNDENKIIVGTSTIVIDTERFSELMTDSGILLDWGNVYLGTINSGAIHFGDTPDVTFSNYTPTISDNNNVDNDIVRKVVKASADQNRHYELKVGVTFPADYTFTEPYIIPVKVEDGLQMFYGIDYIKFNPIKTEQIVTCNNLSQVETIKKSSAESTIYDPNKLEQIASIDIDTFDVVSKTCFSYSIDDGEEILFAPITSASNFNKSDIVQAKEAYFYYNSNGQFITSDTNAFAIVHLFNKDDNQVEWDDWLNTITVKLNGTSINDKIVLGVGYDGIITDRETSYVIWPGKDGVDGQKGDKGDAVQDAYFLTAVYDEGSGNWATWFDNIRNGVPGYSWTPGELGQQWIVNYGTEILTETPVTLEQPTMTPVLKYLWKTSRAVIYNGNTPSYGEWSVPVLASQTGPKGEDGESVVTYEYLNGTIMRVSAWNDGTTESTKYWAGETRVLGEGSSEHDGGNEGIKYLDVVSVTSDGKTNWYKCIANHAKRSANPATDTSYWSEFSIMGDAAFRNLLVENAAYIESLSSKQVVITDDNNIVAGMTSGTISGTELDGEVTPGDIRIWAGATENGNLSTAPFTVDKDGKLISDNADITGEIHAESGTIDGELIIGSDGKISTIKNFDDNGNTAMSKTTLSSGGVTTEVGYGGVFDMSKYADVSQGKVRVAEKYTSQGQTFTEQAILDADNLLFADTSDNSLYAAVTTPYQLDGHMIINNLVRYIQVVDALPSSSDIDPTTIYFVL